MTNTMLKCNLQSLFKVVTTLIILFDTIEVKSQGYIGMTIAEIQKEISLDNSEGYKTSIEKIEKNRTDEYGASCIIKAPDSYFLCFFSKHPDFNKRKCVLSTLVPSSGEEATKIFQAFNMAYLKTGELEWICERNGVTIDIYVKMLNGRYLFVYKMRNE